MGTRERCACLVGGGMCARTLSRCEACGDPVIAPKPVRVGDGFNYFCPKNHLARGVCRTCGVEFMVLADWWRTPLDPVESYEREYTCPLCEAGHKLRCDECGRRKSRAWYFPGDGTALCGGCKGHHPWEHSVGRWRVVRDGSEQITLLDLVSA